VFTALSTVSQYFVIGALNWQPALWFFVQGVLAAVMGQFVVHRIVKRFKKSSIISFLLVTPILLFLFLDFWFHFSVILQAFVIFGSGVAMIVTGTLQIVDEGITGFADLCSLSHEHNTTTHALSDNF
jgi:predicted membrane channel-forming protein YqfA (hemolysin III family)